MSRNLPAPNLPAPNLHGRRLPPTRHAWMPDE
jgi:hypothetical protein